MSSAILTKRVRDILVRGHRSKGDAKDASKLADLTAGLITAYKKLYDHEDDEEILTVCLVDALGGLRIHLPELHSSLRQCTEEDIMAVLAYMQARHLQEEPGPLLIGINPECSVYMSVILPAREPLVCQGCGMHYRCRVNASRCLSSHVSDADAARKPLYSRQELEQHWEGLDADARKCIMGACGLPMPWRVETIGAEELLDDAMRKSEFTYLFRVTTSPALFDFEYDDTIYTIWNMNATGADRLMHALVASYETHKQHVADELLRDTSNKKKKQKKKLTAEMVKGDEILAKKYEEQKEKKRERKRLAKIEKRFFSTPLRIGITGKWYEEEVEDPVTFVVSGAGAGVGVGVEHGGVVDGGVGGCGAAGPVQLVAVA